MQLTRPAAVAGFFYPAGADELRNTVKEFLAEAQTRDGDGTIPKVLIAPHAGYVYSGAVAASAYSRVAAAGNRFERVVLLGPAHRVRLHGLALPAANRFETPLGIVHCDEAHAQEHSLEVHLPFLQLILGEFCLVPLVVGAASAEQVAAVLERLWGGDETLIVISSDLSHYLPYPRACAKDEFTAEAILRLQPQLDHEQACGATPINGLLLAARAHGLQPHLLDLRNSGDTAGDKSRVVGYASFAFNERAS